jgi:hypothetical protein
MSTIEVDRLFNATSINDRVCVSTTVAGAEYREMAAKHHGEVRAYAESVGFAFEALELAGEPEERWPGNFYEKLIECKWEGMARALRAGCRAIIWLDADIALMNRPNASRISAMFGLDDARIHGAMPFADSRAKGVLTVLKNTPHSLKVIDDVLRVSRTKIFPDGQPYGRPTSGYEQTMLGRLIDFSSGMYADIPRKRCALSPKDAERYGMSGAAGKENRITFPGLPGNGGATMYAEIILQPWGFYGVKHFALDHACATCDDCGLSHFVDATLSALKQADTRRMIMEARRQRLARSVSNNNDE